MQEPDQKFTIGIGFKSETSQAESAKDVLKDLKKETGEAAESEKLFAGEGREMHKVVSEITRISPELGEALRIAMNPIGGTVAAAIGLFVLMKEHITEVNKELDDLGEKAAEPEFLEGIRARADALREARDAAQEYAAQLVSVVEGEHSVTAELTAQLALLAAISAARGEQAKAEQALAIAQITADEARGVITPEQSVQKRADVQKQAILDEAQRKQDDQDQQLAAKQAALDKANAALPDGHEAVKKLQEDYSAESAHRAATAKNFGPDSDLVKQLPELQKRLETAQANLERLQKSSHGYRGQKGSSLDEEWTDAEQQVASAQGMINA
jgi:hypothetical protein